MPKTAFITGITGQDGAYLSDFLLDKGYTVHGLRRRSSSSNIDRLSTHIEKGLCLHYGDMTDAANIMRLVGDIQPDEIYNFAAQSHVHISFDVPEYTGNSVGLGNLRILEAVRILGMEKHVKFFQASSSELFGAVKISPQNETTPFYPRSPYAIAKLYAYWMTVNYREAYGIFAANGIMFNHESPMRNPEFVTRKVNLAVSRISKGLQDSLYLGNLDARRDWSHAKDIVQGAWKILQHPTPEDFVLASGVAHSVRQLVEKAFQQVDINIEWSGSGQDEIGRDSKTGKVIIRIDKKFMRPTEVDNLLGNSSKAKEILGWATKITFDDLIKEMVASDLKFS